MSSPFRTQFLAVAVPPSSSVSPRQQEMDACCGERYDRQGDQQRLWVREKKLDEVKHSALPLEENGATSTWPRARRQHRAAR